MLTLCDDNQCQENGVCDETALVQLQEILPVNHHYVVCNCSSLEPGSVQAYFRISLSSKAEALEWKDQFQQQSKTTLRVRKTVRSTSSKVLYHIAYRCQHNTTACLETQRKTCKNTDCPASLILKVFAAKVKCPGAKGAVRASRSKDPHRLNYPTAVTLNYSHNHPILAPDALKHRDVAELTRHKLEDLLQRGYSPADALHLHKHDMHIEDSEKFPVDSVDRALCPDRSYVYRLSYKMFKDHDGSSDGAEEQISQLQEFIEGIRNASRQAVSQKFKSTQDNVIVCEEEVKEEFQQPQDHVRMDVTDDGQVVIAICTPLMRRVHKLVPNSGAMVFCDASGNLERNQCRVILLLAQSCAGGLPLGALVVTSESQKTLAAAFELYSSMLDEDAFYGRGAQGPSVIMTDDSAAERSALSSVFPQAKLLLCVFHVLQAFWRYLYDGKNGVKREERLGIFYMLKTMLYANTPDQLHAEYETAMANECLKKYEGALKIVQQLYERRREWAVCHREDLLLFGNRINNFCEAAMRVLKDKVVLPTRAFNIQPLVDFLLTRMEVHYKVRCSDVANDRLDSVQKSRYLLIEAANPDDIVQVSETEYEVKSSTTPTTHRVDMALELCSCLVGSSGAPCKHQSGVIAKYGVQSWNFIPQTDTTMRHLLLEVAEERQQSDDTWFEPLLNTIKVEEDTSHFCDDATDPLQYTDTCISHPAPECSNVRETDAVPEEIATAKDDLLYVFQQLQNRLEADPELFLPAVNSFTKSFGNIHTDAGRVSALLSFGKYTGVALPSAKVKLCSNKHIGVQPAQGRKRGVGRPRKTQEAKNGQKRQGEENVVSAASLPNQTKKPKATGTPHNSTQVLT